MNALILVVSFHAIEDEIVKSTFKNFSRSCNMHYSSELFVPDFSELRANPKSRTAKLRFITKKC